MMRKLLYFAPGLVLIVISALLAGSSLASNGVRIGQPFDPASIDDDLSEHHIIYLLDEAAFEADSLLSPENLLGKSVQVVDNMEDVKEAQNLDALVIHVSARDEVDHEWVADAVRRGLVLVTIDVPMGERAQWINSECDREEAESHVLEMETQGSHYAYLSMVVVATDNEKDIPLIADYQLNLICHQPRPPKLNYFAGAGSTRQELNTLDDAAKLREQISFTIGRRDMTFYNFANRHSPTPVPHLPPPLGN